MSLTASMSIAYKIVGVHEAALTHPISRRQEVTNDLVDAERRERTMNQPTARTLTGSLTEADSKCMNVKAVV